MRVNKEIISKLGPCKNRFDNYLEYYSDFDGTLQEFILLDKITHKDKIWVITKLFDDKQKSKWAIKCAFSVLYIYEKSFPSDDRPRKAIEAAQECLSNPAARAAAYAAADDAARAAAYAARAAAYAAAYAAYAAAYAADDDVTRAARAAVDAARAAAYAAADDAARAAAYAADDDVTRAAAYDTQKQLNLKFAIEVLNETK
jgi:hypothetical protein